MLKGNALKGLLLAGAAFVATPSVAAVVSDGDKPAASGQLDEIVVTARRTQENLQTTPVAVTALSGLMIDKLNIQDVSAVPQFTPNLSISQQPAAITAASVYIRGIGNASPSAVSEQGVGIYLDGVYIARSAGAIFDLVDLERIEVLRGPQGTLFGRNSVGGGIQLVSKKPTNEMGLEAKGGYARFDDWFARARIDTGYLGGLPIKAAFSYQHRQRDGFFDNTLAPSSKDPGALNSDAVTAAVQGDFGKLTVNYMFDYNQREGTPSFFQIVAATDDVRNYFGQSAAFGGAPFQIGTKGLRQGQQAYVRSPDGVPTIGVRAKVQGHALTLNYEALPELTLKSITAYRKYRQDGTNSLSGNGVLKGFTLNPILFVDGTVIPEGINTVNPYDGYTPQRQRQISQEFQALGKSGDFSYVAGAFYFNEKSSEANFQELTFVLPGGDAGVNLSPLQAFRGTAESYALFGQTSYTPNGGDLELTAGLRYTWDQKTLLLAGDVNPPRPARAAFENLSWLLSANYKFSNAAMAYVRASSGFRSGGINPASSTINTFAPEKVVSYEGGIKAEWFDRRLRTNLAAFYVDYKDLQISQFEAGSGGATSTIINAGKVVYKGIEAEITAIPVDGLTLDLSFGYTDPTYKTYLYRDPQTDMVTNVANEARMSQTAKFNSHIGAQYETDIGFATLSLRTDYAYRSTIYWFTLDRINKFNREIRSRPDHNLRARIGLAGIEVAGGTLDLGLWGDNLTNDRNIDFGIDFGDLGFGSASFKKPRTLGVDAKLTY